MIEFFSRETWWLEDLSWVFWTAFKFPHSAACLLSMIHVMILKAFSMKDTAKIKQWIEQQLEKFVNVVVEVWDSFGAEVLRYTD